MTIRAEDYIYLVKRIAKSKKQTLTSPQVRIEDLESAGYLGLLDAICKFDKSKNTRFATYASIRINGAIGDELRRIDWVPRVVRQRKEDVVGMSHFSDTVSQSSHENDDEQPSFIDERESIDLADLLDKKLRVEEAIAMLKPKYQEAVRLRYFEDLNLKDTARHMGISESRVCQILKKARSLMKPILKDN